MPYTVKQLSKLAGVSVRTLHHYDDIGLLKPARVQSNGYRQYDKAELLRLQQILFFRELDFSLADIQRMMDFPAFDEKKALLEQKHLLDLKRKRLGKLIKTIEKTIHAMSTNQMPTDDELYNAFEDEDVKQYQEEVKQRWGHTDAYKQSMERVGKMTKAQMQKIKDEQERFTAELATMLPQGAQSPEVQKMIDRHYNGLRTFYEPTLEMYKGLAEMYIADPRFAAYYNKHHPEMAQFMHDAMLEYIKQRS